MLDESELSIGVPVMATSKTLVSRSGFLDEDRLSIGVLVWLTGMNLSCAVVSQSGLLDESTLRIKSVFPEHRETGTPNHLDSAGGLLDESLEYWCPGLACWMKTG